jgi:hypothetical protein
MLFKKYNETIDEEKITYLPTSFNGIEI